MTEHDLHLIEIGEKAGAAKAQATIEAQAAEIDRLKQEVERRSYDGIHTCHDECQRVPCRQRREIERLRGIVAVWLDLAVGPDEMGDYYRQKRVIKESQEALGKAA
jgi:hypothetical protein